MTEVIFKLNCHLQCEMVQIIQSEFEFSAVNIISHVNILIQLFS